MKIRKFVFFAVAAVLGAVSCSKDSGTEGLSAHDEFIAGLTPMKVSPDRERILLKNPLSGWVLYSGIGSGLAANYWDTYDNFDYTENGKTGKIKVSDYSNVLYIKADWAAMNPEDGVYIWEEQYQDYSDFARNLKYLMAGAKERGMKIAFTINTNSQDDHSNSTPDFVREEDPTSCFETTTGSAKVYSAYPDHPVFQKYYAKFIEAFAKRFNNPDEVEFISGLGLGKWGECHSFRYSTENTLGKGDESPRWDVYDWATSLYAENFTRVPVVTNYHKMVGKTADSGSPDQMSTDLLNMAIDKGFAMRHDAFGMKSYYGSWEKNFIAGHKYEVPVIGEGGWVQSSHDFTGDYPDVRALREGEYEVMAGAYVNIMDLRYSSSMSTSETWSWFNDAYDLVLQFLREGVYRLYPDTVYLQEEVSAGSSAKASSTWTNLGQAYCPTNIKQWEDRYKMAYALLDKESGDPVSVFVDDAARIETIVKNSRQTFDFTIDLSGVAAGEYEWAIAIVNTQKDNTPGIELSCKEDDMTESGWLRLMDVTVK